MTMHGNFFFHFLELSRSLICDKKKYQNDQFRYRVCKFVDCKHDENCPV